MAPPPYKRVLVKLSGEALQGGQPFGLDPATLRRIAEDLAAARALGVELAVVVGGGNFFRGVLGVAGGLGEAGLDRATGDQIGMLATVMNCLAFEAAVAATGTPAVTLSAVAMPSVCEPYARQRALAHLGKGRVVLLAGGTGNPFFTTDTGAALRAAELGCAALLKATNVDGVYSADPKSDPSATRYDRLTHSEALDRRLGVMDAAAFALARDSRMPIIVFSIQRPGAIAAVLRGEGVATLVTA